MQVRIVEKLLNCKGLNIKQPTRISKYEVCENKEHIKYFDNLEQVVDWFFEVFYG